VFILRLSYFTLLGFSRTLADCGVQQIEGERVREERRLRETQILMATTSREDDLRTTRSGAKRRKEGIGKTG